MSNPKTGFKNRNIIHTSTPGSPVAYSPPISWFYPVGSGNVVLKDESGNAVTFPSLTGYEGGIRGPFIELTSFTCTRVWLGDGEPPAPPSPTGAASGITIADAGGFTAETQLEGATQEIYQHLKSTQGVIWLPPSAFYLATGAPLAVFADGASAVPGSALVDSEAFGIRWNNNATLNAIVTSFLMPPDCDITANATLTVRASKTGATVGDAVTFDVAAFNQVVGALHDADADFGAGVTTAMTGNATAKTVQSVTRTLALADLAAFPASVTMTLKPTNGTLGTDDLLFLGAHILYKKKLLTS